MRLVVPPDAAATDLCVALPFAARAFADPLRVDAVYSRTILCRFLYRTFGTTLALDGHPVHVHIAPRTDRNIAVPYPPPPIPGRWIRLRPKIFLFFRHEPFSDIFVFFDANTLRKCEKMKGCFFTAVQQ
jgi:hypothetical protein